MGYTTGTDEKESYEYPLPKEDIPVEMANSDDRVLRGRKVDNLEYCLALFLFCQKPRYQDFIKVGANTETQHTLVSLFIGYEADPELVKCSFLPPNWQPYVAPFNALLLILDYQASSLPQSFLSIHVCRGDLHARARFDIVGNSAVDLLFGTSYMEWCICGFILTEWRVVPIHFCPVAILMFSPKVMQLLKQVVQNEAIV